MARKNKSTVRFDVLDPSIKQEQIEELEKGEIPGITNPLLKSIITAMERSGDKGVRKLAIERDPDAADESGDLYFEKTALIPDKVLKRVSYTDDLVGTIANVRSNHISAFAHLVQDRRDLGYRIEPVRHGLFDKLKKEQQEEIMKKANSIAFKLQNCGELTDRFDIKNMSLRTFLAVSARNAIIFGRFATEILWKDNLLGEKKFYGFRPADAGTIYKAVPNSSTADQLRQKAYAIYTRLYKEKFPEEKNLPKEDFAYVQVIDNKPIVPFTAKEMVVHNCYPNTDVELNGYPVTPIDIAVQAITTHINITNHNKLYFQNGRASRGMLVINSDSVDQSTLHDLKQSMNALINGNQNAWRMPVIAVGPEEKVQWQQIDTMSRDAEFQYLTDSNARVIMSVFGVSPEEIPGYAHLSKGTNNQSLSESNNEYKLEAARDAGIRPLLAHFKDFFNTNILPLFDEEVAKYCQLQFYGLDSDSADKETARLTDTMQIYETYDSILRQVEREPIGKSWGGEFPLNPNFQAMLDKYFTVGQIKEHFFGIKDASKDPNLDYMRDNFYFQNKQLIQAQQQMEEQKQIAQQQLAQQQQGGGQPQGQAPGQSGGDKQQPSDPKGDSQNSPDADLTSGIDQLLGMLSKSEKQFSEAKRKIIQQHDEIVNSTMEAWENESKELLSDIAVVVDKNRK